MKKKVNIALQVLPKSGVKNSYEIVDAAIEVIKNSGVTYRVCPFETVMEGDYDELMEIAKEAQDACYAAGADEMMVYIKVQHRADNDTTIDDKMKNYD